MSDYRIWFKVEGFEPVQLPVNPQDVSITYPGNPTNYDVEGVGDVIIPRITKLATMTFESFFPREYVYQTVLNSDVNFTPEWYVNFFRMIQTQRKVFELTIVRGTDTYNTYTMGVRNPIPLNTEYFDTVFPMAVLIDFTQTDKGGEPGDIYFSMTVSEYRDPKPKTIAEIAAETRDIYGSIMDQQLVMVVNRPQQSGRIVSGRAIEINGKVFMTEEELIDQWNETKQFANQVDRVVTRVLPPQVSNKLHSVYVDGMGWVNHGDCKLSEMRGDTNRLSGIITNEYNY